MKRGGSKPGLSGIGGLELGLAGMAGEGERFMREQADEAMYAELQTREAKEFTPEQWKRHKEQHPGAKREDHTIKRPEGKGTKDKPKPKPSRSKSDEKAQSRLKKRKEKEPPPAKVEDLPEDDAKKLKERYRLEIVGDDAHKAAEIRKKVVEGIQMAADLCKQKPPVCEGNKGIPRHEMPQIENKTIAEMLKGHPGDQAKAKAAIAAGADPDDDRSILDQFVDRLKKAGIDHHDTEIPVGKLMATQRELITDTVYGIADVHLRGKFDASKGIVVSRDGYILDGHHRWAALLTIDPDRKMEATVIDMDMDDLLAEAHAQPGSFLQGMDDKPLPAEKQKEHKKKRKSKLPSKANPKGKPGKPEKKAHMDSLRSQVIRLAHAKPELRSKLLPLLKEGKEWPSEEARKKYLQEHPKADPKRHTVRSEQPGKPKKDDEAEAKPKVEDEAKAKPSKGKPAPSKGDADAEKRLKQREEGHKPQDPDLKDYEPPSENPPTKLKPEHLAEIKEYKLDIVGDDAVAAVEIKRRAKEFAEKLKKGIKESADICKVNPPVCEGNMGLTRDKMPQITDDSVQDMLGAMGDDEYKALAKQVEKSGLKSIEDAGARKRFLKRAKGEAALQAGADPDDKRPVFDQFLDGLGKSGVKTKEETIPVGKLKATQSEIEAEKAIGMADSHLAGKFPTIDASVVVSRDGHILDGHHRWAAIMTIDPAREMKVKVIDMDMKDLLHEAASFPGVFQAALDSMPLPEGKQKEYKGKHTSKVMGGGKGKKADEQIIRAHLVRVAYENPELRPKLLPLLREALEHPNEQARKEYLRQHENADPKNHTVRRPKGLGKVKELFKGDKKRRQEHEHYDLEKRKEGWRDRRKKMDKIWSTQVDSLPAAARAVVESYRMKEWPLMPGLGSDPDLRKHQDEIVSKEQHEKIRNRQEKAEAEAKKLSPEARLKTLQEALSEAKKEHEKRRKENSSSLATASASKIQWILAREIKALEGKGKKADNQIIRAHLVRVAYENPELRPKLLPLLKESYGGLPRSAYLPRHLEGVDPDVPTGTDLAIWQWEENGKLYAIAFQGRAKKPLWNYRFRNEGDRQRRIQETIEVRRKWIKAKAEERRKRKEYKHDYVVGDVLYSSWGYDQTNINFYEVVATKGKQVVVREIGKKVVREERGADYVAAVPGRYTGPELRRRPSMGGSIKINTVQRASKWDGKPKYQTAFGWGH